MLEEIVSNEKLIAATSLHTVSMQQLPNVENTPVEIVDKTIIDLVKNNLEQDKTKNEIGIQISPDIKCVIYNIISLTPDTLTDIEKVILEIVKDGRIDSKDIPNLIVVLQKIYKSIYSLKNVKFNAKKRAEITSTSLKYIIHILVLNKKIKIEEHKVSEFLALTDALIDSCISLLNFSNSLKTKGCFKKIF